MNLDSEIRHWLRNCAYVWIQGSSWKECQRLYITDQEFKAPIDKTECSNFFKRIRPEELTSDHEIRCEGKQIEARGAIRRSLFSLYREIGLPIPNLRSIFLDGSFKSHLSSKIVESQTNFVEIFTDGACKGNPGRGGWGVYMRFPTHEKELSGFEPRTTNNRMELMAAIQALKALKTPHTVILTTDSNYLREGITKWVSSWKKNNWKTREGKPVKNIDLWIELLSLSNLHQIEWKWIKAHAGHRENERADRLASDAANS